MIQHHVKGIALSLAFLSAAALNIQLPSARAAEHVDYQWRNVAIGGGGYVTGIVAHPTVPNLIYIRTDVGGVYRYSPSPDAQGRNWIPLFDKFGFSFSNYFGVESIAIAPADPDVVYAAAGKTHWVGKGRLLKSTNRGETWVETGPPLTMEGGGDYKEDGERLAVDPFDSQLVYFGSRDAGLLQTTDGGQSWHTLDNAPKATAPAGVIFVLPNPIRRAQGDSRHAPVYIAVAGVGIALSEDAGRSWQALGGPAEVSRGAVASDGTIFVTGPHSVSRYRDGSWQDVSPEGDQAYGAITIDPRAPKTIIVSASGGHFNLALYLSNDGGTTWKTYSTTLFGAVSWKANVPWWEHFAGDTSALLIDPHTPGRLWLTDWSGTWIADDYREPRWTFRTYERGHEELVINSLATPPKGLPLLSAIADASGFRHESLDSFPVSRYQDHGVLGSFGIDYCPGNPDLLVRAGVKGNYGPQGQGVVALSKDNGRSWSWAANWDAKLIPSKIAYSATNPGSFVVLPVGAPPYSTQDFGVSWVAGSGIGALSKTNLWAPRHTLAADRKNGNTYYFFDEGIFYRSQDGGKNWKVRSTLPNSYRVYVEAAPERAGTVWVSLGSNGLYVTRDGGANFEKIASVKQSHLFGLGRHPAGSPHSALYVYGEVDGGAEPALYASDDDGKSWNNITDPNQMMGNDPTILRGDMQVYGRVYIGTGGRGLFVGAPKNGP